MISCRCLSVRSVWRKILLYALRELSSHSLVLSTPACSWIIFLLPHLPAPHPLWVHRFFELLARLLSTANTSLNSEGKFDDWTTVLIADIIIPNLVWQAGRTAAALRTVRAVWTVVVLSAPDLRMQTPGLVLTSVPCLEPGCSFSAVGAAQWRPRLGSAHERCRG
jgi:hypothetical protein